MHTSQLFPILSLYPSNPQFPASLRLIPDLPSKLYVQGVPLQSNEKSITVIGARAMTPYGASATQSLVKSLVNRGWTIISGLAFGIDALAHRTAIQHGGRTIAVIPSGLRAIAPTTHESLAQEILETGGALYSEYPETKTAQKYHFVQRNRLLAGIADGVLVIEAGKRSGTQITVSRAADYGKPVFVVPGSMFSPMSEGTKQFVNMGAKLITRVEDIEEEFGISASVLDTTSSTALSEDERAIIAILQSHQLVSLNDMLALMHKETPHVLQAITSLELAQYIKKDFGGYRIA